MSETDGPHDPFQLEKLHDSGSRSIFVPPRNANQHPVWFVTFRGWTGEGPMTTCHCDIRSGKVEFIQDSGTTAPPIPEAVG